jgi:hypothetical protein
MSGDDVVAGRGIAAGARRVRDVDRRRKMTADPVACGRAR